MCGTHPEEKKYNKEKKKWICFRGGTDTKMKVRNKRPCVFDLRRLLFLPFLSHNGCFNFRRIHSLPICTKIVFRPLYTFCAAAKRLFFILALKNDIASAYEQLCRDWKKKECVFPRQLNPHLVCRKDCKLRWSVYCQYGRQQIRSVTAYFLPSSQGSVSAYKLLFN